MAFHWDEKKNSQLQKERFLSFERIVVAIEEGHLVDIIENPNQEKYKGQFILVIDIDGYAVCVPSVREKNGDYFLKTLFPSRKYTKKYNLGGMKQWM